MSSDKILHRIQLQINELAPTLELFVDDTIQPSVTDCETLQKSLNDLQENLAVYKYNKQNKELSPSFNIHAKLSAAVDEKKISPPIPETKTEIAEEIKQSIKLEHEEKAATLAPEKRDEPERLKTENETAQPKPPIAVGINDKFRFMNELFSQNSSEYNIAIEQINNLNNWSEGEIYLNSLKNVYEWPDDSEVVTYFYSLVKKRFD